MNLNQEVRVVRLSLVTVVIASTMGLVILFAIPYDNSGISIMSGFGEIIILDPKQPSILEYNLYQNNKLSFQLSTPNDAWNIRQAFETISADELAYLDSKGYLDGIYVEKEFDERFLVSVFEMPSENFQLNDYITKQITLSNLEENTNVPIKQVSQSNEWAIFSLDRGTNAENSYTEQLLFLKDNQLYVIQYFGKSPEYLTDSEKSDINSILGSFEVI